MDQVKKFLGKVKKMFNLVLHFCSFLGQFVVLSHFLKYWKNRCKEQLGSGFMMKSLFRKGDIISGYCNGLFDDGNREKTCVIVKEKYVVFEYNDGNGIVLNYSSNMENIHVDDLYSDWALIRE